MPALLRLPINPANQIIRGDTWYGVAFTLTKAGNPVDLTAAAVKITFISRLTSWTLQTGGNGITITNAIGGEMKIDKIQSLLVEPGVYNGDLQITFANGDISTYIQIELTVTDDITK